MTDQTAPAAESIAASGASSAPTERADDAPAHPRYVLAALTAGGAAIHFAMVPIHAGDDALHGIVFAVGAWAQVVAAGALLLRGDRRSVLLSIAVNAAAITTWIISRTLGLPLGAHAGHPEAITIVDGTTTAMEVLAVLGAAALLARPNREARSLPTAATAAACAAIMLATGGLLIHDDARGHAHGDHTNEPTTDDGHDHGDMPATTMPMLHDDGHDHGDMPATTMPMDHEDGHDHGDMPATTMPMDHEDGHDHEH